METPMSITKEQIKAGLGAIRALADLIKEVESISSGELYALIMPTGITLEQYTSLLNILKKAGLVEERNNILYWVDPNVIKKLPALLKGGDRISIPNRTTTGSRIETVEGIEFIRPWSYKIRFISGNSITIRKNVRVSVLIAEGSNSNEKKA